MWVLFLTDVPSLGAERSERQSFALARLADTDFPRAFHPGTIPIGLYMPYL
jgi:hypothetical protein